MLARTIDWNCVRCNVPSTNHDARALTRVSQVERWRALLPLVGFTLRRAPGCQAIWGPFVYSQWRVLCSGASPDGFALVRSPCAPRCTKPHSGAQWRTLAGGRRHQLATVIPPPRRFPHRSPRRSTAGRYLRGARRVRWRIATQRSRSDLAAPCLNLVPAAAHTRRCSSRCFRASGETYP